MPRRMSASAKPITPSPMRRMRLESASISGSGNLFASMTLSRKCVEVWMSRAKASQSIFPSRTYQPTLIEPRLQTSYGRSGCSPHGLVAS